MLTLLAAYALLMVAAGAWVSRRVRQAGDFFVAGRQLSAGLVFATFLAANIGAGSTVGAAGLGYRFGLSAWWWSGSAALGCLVLGLWVAPRLHRLAAAESATERLDARIIPDFATNNPPYIPANTHTCLTKSTSKPSLTE